MKGTNLKKAKSTTEKGITLVALIITIIVLLILAVVAIKEVQGDGIISHAKNAQTEYEAAQVEEEFLLAYDEYKIEKNINNTQTSLADFIKEKTTFENVVDNNNGTITVTTEKGKNFTFDAYDVPTVASTDSIFNFSFDDTTTPPSASITGIKSEYIEGTYIDYGSYIWCDSFEYFKNANGDIITSLEIPTLVENEGKKYTVTSVTISAPKAPENNITDVTFPLTVKQISGFQNFTKLENVTFSENASIFNGYELAFESTPWLESKYDANGILILNGTLYDGKDATGEVTIPNTVTKIAERAFVKNTNITKINLPNTIISIGDRAFAQCTNLETITNLPVDMDTDAIIRVFYNADSADYPFPLPKWLLNNCNQAHIGDGIYIYNNILFRVDTAESNMEITIPEGVTRILKNAIFGTSQIATLNIPSSVTTIDERGLHQSFGGITTININRSEGAISGAPWGAKASDMGDASTINWTGTN